MRLSTYGPTSIHPRPVWFKLDDVFAHRSRQWSDEGDFEYMIYEVDAGVVFWWSDSVANDWAELLPSREIATKRLEHLLTHLNDGKFGDVQDFLAELASTTPSVDDWLKRIN